eukprot:461357_1
MIFLLHHLIKMILNIRIFPTQILPLLYTKIVYTIYGYYNQLEIPEAAKYNIESKQSSQDSFIINSQTARAQRKSKHNEIHSNATVITNSTKKIESDNTYYKSHSHARMVIKIIKYIRNENSNTNNEKHINKIEKIKSKKKKLNFNNPTKQ